MGCWSLVISSPPAPRTPNSPDLHSRVFSHVEVIGARGTGLGQFTKPRSLALDRDDNLFVVDLTGRVQKFSPGGEVLSSWRMPETDLGKPKGMCRDTNGNIVIVEPHYQRVNHFAPDGTLVEQWGAHGTNGGQLVLPRSVAANRHGDIFVSEYTTVDRVQGFSANGRKPILLFGKPGTGNGEFNRAEGLDVDAQDRIYVADSCNHRIQIFSRDGKWLKTYGKAGRGLGELSYPFDVRVDRAGRQYVCEFGNSRIQVFGTNNEPLEIIGGPGEQARTVQQPLGHRARFARQPVRRGCRESSSAEARGDAEAFLWNFGRAANRLTPHPGPLPVEGRGSRVGCTSRFGRHCAAFGSFGPALPDLPKRSERGETICGIPNRSSRPLSPQRGEGRGEG
ncbi:MAG: hypothetical protein IPK15_17720 [Verrucomicrobia bacterium]|nr:hypothetical protein [Verrucomicrobiota bacterium]